MPQTHQFRQNTCGRTYFQFCERGRKGEITFYTRHMCRELLDAELDCCLVRLAALCVGFLFGVAIIVTVLCKTGPVLNLRLLSRPLFHSPQTLLTLLRLSSGSPRHRSFPSSLPDSLPHRPPCRIQLIDRLIVQLTLPCFFLVESLVETSC
jgi:hypothetical protein